MRLTYPDYSPGGGGIGCREADTGGTGDDTRREGGVNIVDAGRIGYYSYELVEATESTDVVDWLDDNGYKRSMR